MSEPGRTEWLAARRALLEREKALTRLSDELAEERRQLPPILIHTAYEFDTDDGRRTLLDLFGGRTQLLVYHFMHGPFAPEGCTGCTFAVDSYNGSLAHLHAHDVSFVLSSRSPLPVLQAYKARMGWTIPWVSTIGPDFHRDFGSFTDEDRANGTGYNFGTLAGATIDLRTNELMGLSAFQRVGSDVFHTYSTYDRGTDAAITTWALLDRTPRGREDDRYPDFPRRHDEY